MNLPAIRPEPPTPGRRPDLLDPADPVAAVSADPEHDHPRLAAARFHGLLAGVEGERERLRAERSASDELGAEAARRHRETAAAIRDRVEEVWDSLSEPLAVFGITELDDIRVEAPAADAPVPGRARGRTPGKAPGGHPPEATGRMGGAPGRGGRQVGPGRPAAVSMDKTSPAGGGIAAPRGRAELVTVAQRAHDHCMVAMSRSAELRAELKPAADASAALVTGVGVLAGAGLALVLRVYAHLAGLPAIAVGVTLAACLVGAASGGARAVGRAALFGGAAAAVVVLMTARVTKADPPSIILSVLLILTAARFGLGIGRRKPEPAPAPAARGRNKRRR